MSSAAIVLDTHFFAQVEDAHKWEDRFDMLVNELRSEYGPFFVWSTDAPVSIDVLFILYPPSQHERMVADRILQKYLSSNHERLSHVHVIVVGRNSKYAKVVASDVVEIVNLQCIPSGVKADSLRVIRPEELDDRVRASLVRLHTRRQMGVPPVAADSLLSEDTGVASPAHRPSPPYESSDL